MAINTNPHHRSEIRLITAGYLPSAIQGRPFSFLPPLYFLRLLYTFTAFQLRIPKNRIWQSKIETCPEVDSSFVSYLLHSNDKGEGSRSQFPSENKIREKLAKQYSGQYDLSETDKNTHIFLKELYIPRQVNINNILFYLNNNESWP